MAKDIPPCLHSLIAGASVEADHENVNTLTPPKWMDKDLLETGRKFAMRNFSALSLADVLSLVVILTSDDGRKALVYTNRSSTVFTAFKRYLSTANRVLSWYEFDLFDPSSEAARNMQAVRRMHQAVRNSMTTTDAKKVKKRSTLDYTMLCPMGPRLRADLEGSSEPIQLYDEKGKVWFNQTVMAFTQFGFIGLMILYPQKLGAFDATDKDLEGLVHLWAVIGHLLGIKDEYNICFGGLALCKQKCRAFVDLVVIPSLARIDAEWEHMARCIVEGLRLVTPGLTFEASLLYVSWVLDMHTPTLSTAISFEHHCRFRMMRFMMTWVIWLPGQRTLGVWLLRRGMQKANEASDEMLEKLKAQAEAYPSTIKDLSE